MPASDARDLERILSELVIQFVDMEVAAHLRIVTECEGFSPSSKEDDTLLYGVTTGLYAVTTDEAAAAPCIGRFL